MKATAKGFSLVELLVVVAIIGILAAIAVPNLLNALQRSKQKSTMADMRTIGNGLEIYTVDYNRVPATTSYTQLRQILLDTQSLGNVPKTDHWGGEYKYSTDPTYTFYTVRSYGRDATKTDCAPTYLATLFDCDIAFSDGVFTMRPGIR